MKKKLESKVELVHIYFHSHYFAHLQTLNITFFATYLSIFSFCSFTIPSLISTKAVVICKQDLLLHILTIARPLTVSLNRTTGSTASYSFTIPLYILIRKTFYRIFVYRTLGSTVSCSTTACSCLFLH